MYAEGMSWTIGDLAERIGVTPRALRHWEREGLLPRPPRSSGGYRLYHREHLLRLVQIKALRQMGLSVPEIRTCLETSSPRKSVLLHVRRTRERIRLQQQVCGKPSRAGATGWKPAWARESALSGRTSRRWCWSWIRSSVRSDGVLRAQPVAGGRWTRVAPVRTGSSRPPRATSSSAS